ncbi:uncharacterized protein LOC108739373 [Agrilus planipennis]|uniref:Uncharacterized protein LOC108739373 n=1 Tax=Agrilus planipennis TaxID=224129 RepID=A0A1W4WXZ9_AGRPL|nr:uncharacterized protein LOC108739373 [Agrilus planipennis]
MSDSFVKDSTHFIERLETLNLQPGDMLVSFDVVYLFTMVPVKEALEYIRQIFPEDITALFRLVLTTTYLQWNNTFYEQADRFTMEKENNGKLAYLDELVNRKSDGSLGHTVYCKVTHTDRYFNKNLNHYPAQKQAILKTLIHRANHIWEASLLDQKLRHLGQALKYNGYKSQEIKRALHSRKTAPETPQPPPVGFASLPYIKTVTDRIGLLKRHNIRTFFKTHTTAANLNKIS